MIRSLTGRALTATLTVIVVAAVLAGCGASVDPALVTSAGNHGNALEANVVLLQSDVLDDASSRDLKDINAAIDAGDLRKATPGDVRRGQGEIRHRINTLASFRRKMLAAGRKLRNTPTPNFKAYLEKNNNSVTFVDSYSQATRAISRSSAVTLTAISIALTSLERYLDFLEQWEELLVNDDTDNLVDSAKKSDKALATLNRRKTALKLAGNPTLVLKVLVDKMAAATSADSQISALIDELRKQYPKSFLPVHIVEKK